MKNVKEELQKYLPDVEKFLTSVLLEETDIEIASSVSVEQDQLQESLQKEDIYLYSRDQEHEADVIIVLDPVWYGLLSSIMLGVEEKTNNEVTRDLLKKFSGELTTTLGKRVKEEGLELNLEEVQVLTLFQLEKLLSHAEYVWVKMEVEGLADNKVRTELLLGNPEAQFEDEPEPEEESEEGPSDAAQGTNGIEAEDDEDFTAVDAEEMGEMGTREEVVSGKYIEFDEFSEDTPAFQNGDGHSMDLLKDVEMDVSVELGRIELPLGKVLQLAKGSVIELEKLAGEPVDILVNGHRIAHGEVVVIDEHFGVRISNLVTTRKRIAGLN